MQTEGAERPNPKRCLAVGNSNRSPSGNPNGIDFVISAADVDPVRVLLFCFDQDFINIEKGS
jgi:hypothetical protein